MPPWVWPLAIPIAFSVWWCLLLWVTARFCGGSSLARHYRAAEPFAGKLHHFRSGKIGWSNYSGCLTLGADSDGLYIPVFFLFRAGHPPLFIPWADITAARGKLLWVLGEWLEFRAEKAPRTRLLLCGSAGRELARDANRSWDEEGASTQQPEP
jgi:hypothetical protein